MIMKLVEIIKSKNSLTKKGKKIKGSLDLIQSIAFTFREDSNYGWESSLEV